jgi:hypothetical protein
MECYESNENTGKRIEKKKEYKSPLQQMLADGSFDISLECLKERNIEITKED